MYKIIGVDGQQYGPVTAEQIREWIASGRVNAQTMAQINGGPEWKPVSAFPEFAEALAAKAAVGPPPGPPPIVASSDAEALAVHILDKDYRLDIFSCLSRAWEKVQSDFWPIIIDKRLDFWPAMELSRKIITRHWWSFFGLALLSTAINLVGTLLCGVGAFVTAPVTMLALMYAYEDIIGATTPSQALQPL